MNDSPKFKKTQSRQGVALVIVLSFVVLLTALIVAYFSRTMADRQLSNSSFNQSSADGLARSALDIVVSDLKQEIANGSTSSVNGGVTIYTPSATPNIIPKTNISTQVAAAIPNLIRTSLRTDTIPAPGVASRASAANSYSNASANGRLITLERWNKHYLIPTVNSATVTPVSPFNNPPQIDGFTPPDWVFVNDKGPLVIGAPDRSIIGRYAYAIYDEGGLLDVNSAGYPAGMAASDIGKKGFLGFADLTQLPGGITQAQIDNLVGWRNYATIKPDGAFPNLAPNASSASSYLNYLLTNNSGFLTTNVGTWNGPSGSTPHTDQTFLSRQQLLAFQATPNPSLPSPTTFPASALQFLGTFSRELNSPSIPFHKNSEPTASLNPDLNPNFADLVDKDTKKIIRRFPLSRFALLAKDPTTLTATEESQILQYFGLTRVAGSTSSYRAWQYRNATIGTPKDALNGSPSRNPDLFELVKATIFNDSLGAFVKNDGVAYENAPGATSYSPEKNVHQQVARIIANIVDQYDSDNYPTTIQIGANEVYGIESLPYFSELFWKAYFPAGFNFPPTTVNKGALYAYWELWNPHQGNIPLAGPSTIRITANNSGFIMLNYTNGSSFQSVNNNYPSFPASVPFPPKPLPSSPEVIPVVVTNLASYQIQPRMTVNSADTASYITDLSIPFNGWKALAVKDRNTLTGSNINTALQTTNITMALQYLDASSSWRTYTTFAGHYTGPADSGITGIQNTGVFNNNNMGTGASANNNVTLPNDSFVKTDPRTFRFRAGIAVGGSFEKTMASVSFPGQTYSQSWSGKTANPLTTTPSAPANYLLNSNNTTGVADLDGIYRPGDGYLSTATANPMLATATSSRPVILNRPFRSVGELGYVFRDVPWKSIDLFSDKSGDAGLLDLFCLEDNEITAGKVNINTRNAPVLAAMLRSSSRDEIANANPISSSEANTIAADIVAATTGAGGPLLNRAELPGKLAAAPVNATYPAIKTQREAAVRALGTNIQTRTWNLLIDLVAESGRFTPNAASLNAFNVEGSRRYWLHVAIDRYTGEVIDSQLEAVYE